MAWQALTTARVFVIWQARMAEAATLPTFAKRTVTNVNIARLWLIKECRIDALV